MKKAVSEKNKSFVGILVFVAIILVLLSVVWIYRENIDLKIRDDKMLEAYNSRKIVVGKLNEFNTVKEVGVNLENVEVKDGNLNVDMLFKIPEVYVNDKTKLKFGLSVFDHQNIYVLDTNSYINSVVEENKSSLSNVQTNAIYHNELVKEVYGEIRPIEVPRVEKLYEDVVLENGVFKVSYSFPVKGEVDQSSLKARINEVMFFETIDAENEIRPVLYNPFTEWQFDISNK